MDGKSIMEYHSNNQSTNNTKIELDVFNLSKNSNFKNSPNRENHEHCKRLDKDDDSLESNNNNEPSQSPNDNNEKCTNKSNERDDENSNKSLLQEFLSDGNDDIEQNLCSSESNKEKQYESANNSIRKVKQKKSKRYELRANKKENFDKYAVTSSDSDNDTELRQTLKEKDDDYYIKSNDSDYINDILSDAEYENISIREKHNILRRYQLQSSNSYKKYKFNKYNVTSDSQDDDDDSYREQLTHESDNDYKKDYIKFRDNKKSATRDNRKLLNRYKLQRSHTNKIDNVKKYNDATKCVQDIENKKKLSQGSLSDKTDHANKYPNNTKSVQDNEHKKSANEINKTEENDDSDDDKSLYDLIKMEKLKTSQHYELQKVNLHKIDKSNMHAELSKIDNGNEHTSSTYKSNEEFQHNSDNSNGRHYSLNDGDNENTINTEKYENSQNKYQITIYTDASDSGDYLSQSQASNDSHKSDSSDADMNLEECMNILTAYYRSNIAHHKLESIFNLSRKQLRDTLANSEHIIKEYKQKYRDFDENDWKIPKTRICNVLTLEERIEVLRVYSRSSHYDYDQLAAIFNCSKHQIKYTLENRVTFINKYKRQHPEFELKSIKKAVCKTLSWNECIDVIKVYYRTRYSNSKLAKMFNCSLAEIQNILASRKHIIDEYKKPHPHFLEMELKAPSIDNSNTLSLEERIEVLRENGSNQYTCDKLAAMFNCSMGIIESTLANRDAIIAEYKIQHPDFDENELKTPKTPDHPLSLNERIDVIKAYYRHLYPYYKLSTMFNCTIGQIQHIINNRKSIIKEYKIAHPEFDENEMRSEKCLVSSSSNSLGLDERIDVLRAHIRNKYPYYKLASKFNCSLKEIINTVQNPRALIKEYKLKHPNFDEHEFKTNSKLYRSKFSLDKRIEVLKAHHQHHYPYYKLAFMFQCLIGDIKYTLNHRKKFLKNYKKLHPNFDEHEFILKPIQVFKPLTLNDRIAVLKAHDRYQYPYYKLAAMFKCSIGQIEMTVDNRVSFIEQYNKQHTEYVENEMADPHDEDNGDDKGESNSVNVQTMERRCIEVISSYEHEIDYTKLSRLFNFSVAQIKTIIRNRVGIMARYERFKNDNISDKDNESRQNENIYKTRNPNIFTAKATVFKIGTQHEPTDNVNDINQESTKTSNVMGHFNTDNFNPKLLDNDQNNKGDDKDDFNNIDLTNEKSLCLWNGPHMRKYLQVIKAYDEINSYSVVASLFKCSWILVYSIIENRIAILKTLGCPISVKLTFLQRIDVIRDYKCKNYTYIKLAKIYNCKLSEIKKCISDSASYMQIYEKLYPTKSKSKHKPTTIRNTNLSLEMQKEIIKSFDLYPNEMLLCRLYNCSLQQIFEIIKNRSGILNQNNSQTDLFKNLSVSCHQDIVLALKPLAEYAELVSNTTAINIISQFEQHLLSFRTNLPKSNYEIQKNFEFCSYLDVLKALKPIEDYTNSSKNYKAKDATTELAKYLKAGTKQL